MKVLRKGFDINGGQKIKNRKKHVPFISTMILMKVQRKPRAKKIKTHFLQLNLELECVTSYQQEVINHK